MVSSILAFEALFYVNSMRTRHIFIRLSLFWQNMLRWYTIAHFTQASSREPYYHYQKEQSYSKIYKILKNNSLSPQRL